MDLQYEAEDVQIVETDELDQLNPENIRPDEIGSGLVPNDLINERGFDDNQ